MKKIVFLGCENSHSSMFLNYIKNDKKYSDVKVLGVYSKDEEAAKKVGEQFGVPVLKSYDAAADEADGVVITARHGDEHYKYAKPYLKSGVTMFLDKPVTISEDEAVSLMKACKEKNIKITGGSSLRFVDWVKQLKEDAKNEAGGKTLGGIVRCPISLGNVNGGYFFYAQHLVETVQEIFGRYPKSVQTMESGKNLTVNFRYDDYVVTGVYIDEIYKGYYAARITEDGFTGNGFPIVNESPCFKSEWEEFYDILSGGEQRCSYQDFIAPVFVMNAVSRARKSGKEENVAGYEV